MQPGDPTHPITADDAAVDAADEHHEIDEVRVEVEIEVPADVEHVWSAVTDPDQLASWLGIEVDLDVRPGGTGRVVDPDGTERGVIVTDVEPHDRLGWHWWDARHGISSVEIRLTPLLDATRVRVIERTTPNGTTPTASATTMSAAVATAHPAIELRWLGAFGALAAWCADRPSLPIVRACRSSKVCG